MTIKLKPDCELAKAIHELVEDAWMSGEGGWRGDWSEADTPAEARAHLLEVIHEQMEEAAAYYWMPKCDKKPQEIANKLMGVVSDDD